MKHDTVNHFCCIYKDDFDLVFQKMIKADIIIFNSPVYVWSFTAQMKPFFDRQHCLVKWKEGEKAGQLISGKKSMLLVTCAGNSENNADLITRIYKRKMAYLGLDDIGVFELGGCISPDETGKKAGHIVEKMLGVLHF